MTTPQPSEHAIQASFIEYIQYAYANSLKDDFRPALSFAALNEIWVRGEDDNSKHALLKKYKDQGMRAGIPDYHYDQPRGGYTKLVIEFKMAKHRNAKNGGLSVAQIEYLKAIRPYACVNVCYSFEEAREVFDKYMSFDVEDWVEYSQNIPITDRLREILDA